MKRYTWVECAVLAIVICCLDGERAAATKIDITPLPAAMLGRSGYFLAMDSRTSLRLYRLRDAQPVRSFPMPGRFRPLAVSRDERFLLVGGDSGWVSLWDITTGKRLWGRRAPPGEEGENAVSDVSFAWDGERCIARSLGGLSIYVTSTGELIASVSERRIASGLYGGWSAALSPDGSLAAVVLQRGVWFFDVNTGKSRETEWGGFGPIRFSGDGKYVAFWIEDGKIRVVPIAAKTEPKEFGEFWGTRITPVPEEDGFLVLDQARASDDATVKLRIQRITPSKGTLESVLSLPSTKELDTPMSISLEGKVGVWTKYTGVTRVVDLTTGATRFTIDNSARFPRPKLPTTALAKGYEESPGDGSTLGAWALLAVCAVVLLLTLLVWGLRVLAGRGDVR